ncbi:MAG: hypothetical protein GC181_07500 [Bacteroidetes bacterium]|nr:hypothetical protein [Bacteroidota bacterium]
MNIFTLVFQFLRALVIFLATYLVAFQSYSADSDSTHIVAGFQKGLKTRNFDTAYTYIQGQLYSNQKNILSSYIDKNSFGKDVHFKWQCYLLLGEILWGQDELQSADSVLTIAETKLTSLGDRDGAFLCTFKRALIKTRQGVADENVLVLEKGIKFFQQKKDTSDLFKALVSLAYVYSLLDEWNKCITLRLMAARLAHKSGNCGQEVHAYRALADIYMEQKKYDSSRYYFNMIDEMDESCTNKIGENVKATILVSKVQLEILLDSMYDSDSLLSIAQEMFYRAQNKYWYAFMFAMRSYNYYRHGAYQKAREVAEQGLEYSINHNLLKEKKDNYQALYRACAKLNDYKSAYLNFQKFIELEEEMNTESAARGSEKIDMEVQAERDRLKTELEHQALMSKERNRKNFLIFGLILVFLFSVGLFSRLSFVRRANKVIKKEKDRSEELLLNILPAEVAQELKDVGHSHARNYDVATILFTDFKEFTQISSRMSAGDLVQEIDTCFKAFDSICEKYQIEKIKTIGDSYMAAGGLPVPKDRTARDTVLAGLEMMDFILKRKESQPQMTFEMRVGIHTGPVVAGIVGVKKFQYDIWGDTVNTASRMESACDVGRVNISNTTHNYIKDDPAFRFENRGKIEVKGKGQIDMWFVDLA